MVEVFGATEDSTDWDRRRVNHLVNASIILLTRQSSCQRVNHLVNASIFLSTRQSSCQRVNLLVNASIFLSTRQSSCQRVNLSTMTGSNFPKFD